MVKQWLLACVCLCAVLTAQAQVLAQLDRDEVVENDIVTLKLRYSGSNYQDPDFSMLEPNFKILQQMGPSFQSFNINGRKSSFVEFALQLQPKFSGTLVIPGIRFGNETSNELQLKVLPLSQEAKERARENFFMEVELSDKSPHIGQQLMVTLRIFSVAQLHNGLETPKYFGQSLNQIGEVSQYQSRRGDRTYLVNELRYQVTPKDPGDYELPAFSYRGIAEFGFRNQRAVSFESPKLKVKVADIPDEFPKDAPWLIAEDMGLITSLNPSNTLIKSGDSLTLNTRIEGRGIEAESLPDLKRFIQFNGFKTYPSSSEFSKEKGQSRSESIGLVALNEPEGDITFTPVPWWDADEDKVKWLKTGNIRFNIEQPTSAPTATQVPQATSNPVQSSTRSGIWPWLTLAFALAWMVTLGLLVALWHQGRQGRSQVEVTIPKWQQLIKETDDASRRQGVLLWAQEQGHQALSLQQLALAVSQPELAKLLKQWANDGLDGDQWRQLAHLLRQEQSEYQPQGLYPTR